MNEFKKYFDGFDLSKVFRDKMSRTDANGSSARKTGMPVREISVNMMMDYL